MTEVKPVDGIFPIDDDVLAALKALPGWPLHIWMAEMSARIESDRAEIARLKAEVERLTCKAMTCADCGVVTEDLHPASSHPDAAPVCRSCGPNRLDMERQRAWALKLEDALVRMSLAIACFQTGLGAAEDVTTASKDVEELGRQIMAVQADVCPSCAGDLDTGWECNECKADWFWIGAYCSTYKERQTLIDGTGRAR